MYCRQCEQTAAGRACQMKGVCGKTPEAAAWQDLLVYSLIGLAAYGRIIREHALTDREAERLIVKGLFATVTNVNFDPEKLKGLVEQIDQSKEKLRADLWKKGARIEFSSQCLKAAAEWTIPADREVLSHARAVALPEILGRDEEIRSLREIMLYGLKGMAAYADHAAILGHRQEKVNAFLIRGLCSLLEDLSPADYLTLIMELGQTNLACMELLDAAHTGHFGHPVPTKVWLGKHKGPAILISGHDLYDLQQLLQQTEGRGIWIYTHGEMLPAHGYPGLKKYPHLVGHYGTAWQNQQKEFDEFPGAILMTTNCLQKPRDSYQERIFTTGVVGWPGVVHIGEKDGRKDFSQVIEKALSCGGFPEEIDGPNLTVGFGHHTLAQAAGEIIKAHQEGKIRHLFLIGGCDGARPGRNYYTELARMVPDDCLILTLACGKFRFNHLQFGSIGPFPRLLDCGQCNDAYSAIKTVVELAGILKKGVNELPVSLVLSWYEQKAVVILLTLLSLGVRNIRLGPTLPAFVSPGIWKVLQEKFQLRAITTPENDLSEILGR